MNAGTLTQALTASRYKANPTAGSREKQDDTVSFMDMFAQNLKDARKTGTKAADKKRDGAADSKAQEMGDTGRNQASVDQGKKSEPMEDGTCREDSKKAESGVENTDKDSDSGKRHNEGAAAEAINLQGGGSAVHTGRTGRCHADGICSGTRKDGTDPFIQHSFSRS